MTRILKAAGLRGRNKFKLARSVDTLIEALDGGGGRRGHTQPEIIQSITHSKHGCVPSGGARILHFALHPISSLFSFLDGAAVIYLAPYPTPAAV